MRSVEIDIDVHKAIEAARLDFSQTDNDILRLLLGLDKQCAKQSIADDLVPGGKPWRGFNRKQQKWIELAHGTLLLANYSGQEVHGVIDDGSIVVEGQRYRNPSPALIENVTTKAGDRTQLNGWREWRVQINGRWSRLTDL